MAADEASVRIDSWIWSVRLTRTRSMAADACRGGHVRINGDRVKASHPVRPGDEVRLRHLGRDRIVVVTRLVRKRVGAAVAAECFVDNSPPPPPREGADMRSRSCGTGPYTGGVRPGPTRRAGSATAQPLDLAPLALGRA
ncbi:RNA-binding S4 domain-containing protein, partial [Streptomyces radiopugnans]|uniref:RNA-binding S4 domain-containing protein n=1 Tax=Streptomyces radiopugnans TaxID=403935 RepID=UPI003F1A0D67